MRAGGNGGTQHAERPFNQASAWGHDQIISEVKLFYSI